MNMTKKSLGAVLLICIFLAAPAGAEPINIQAGVNIFNDPLDGDSAYIEFPFSVNRNQFSFYPSDSGAYFQAIIYADITMKDTLGNALDSAATIFYTRVADSTEMFRRDIKLFNKLSIMAPPGIYQAVLTVIDVTSKSQGAFIFDRLTVEPPVKDRLALSQLELAHKITYIEDTAESALAPLAKNQLLVTANPMNIFSDGDSMIFLYAELYNLEYQENTPDSFSLHYRIYDDSGKLYRDLGTSNYAKPGDAAVISNGFNVSLWQSGRYDLHLVAHDWKSGQTIERNEKFIIYPEGGFITSLPGSTYWNHLDTAKAVTLTNILKYITRPEQYMLFLTLTDDGKKRFAQQFFRDKDPSPNTARNEYMEDAFMRYAYAIENFSTQPGTSDGWRSDRGRVLMQYGKPDKIEETIVPSKSEAFQLWNYFSIQGGIYFVFYDVDAFGNLRLVHSNASGEKFDKEWEALIKGQDMEDFMDL